MPERPRPPVQMELSTDPDSYATQARRDIRGTFTTGIGVGTVGVIGLVAADASDYKSLTVRTLCVGLVLGGAWIVREAAVRLTDFSFRHTHPENNGVVFEAKEEKDL